MASKTDKTLLDANILIEIVLERLKYQAVVRTITEAAAEHKLVTSILSADLLLYYVEREKRDKAGAFNFLRSYQILDMNEADYEWATQNDQGDFKDALQVACALRHGCKKLITLDAELAKRHNKHIAVKLVK